MNYSVAYALHQQTICYLSAVTGSEHDSRIQTHLTWPVVTGHKVVYGQFSLYAQMHICLLEVNSLEHEPVTYTVF